MTKNLKNLQKSEYFYYDLAALILGAGLFVFLFASARLGVPTVDEADYCNLRYLQGDIPFVEWWDPAQLFWFTMTPVVGLYMKLAGSARGLLLFMRLFFLAADAVFYCFMYRRLRRYRAAGVVGALLFCGVMPQTLLAVSYFTVSLLIFTGACLLLIVDEKKKRPPLLILLGALLAAAIMSEPFLIFVYIIYTVAVCAYTLFMRGKGDPENTPGFLRLRYCIYITLGAFLVFIALMVYLAAKGTFARLPEMLPFIFGGPKYSGASVFGDTKLRLALSFFGAVPAVGFGLLLAAGAALRLIKRPCTGARMALFACSAALAAYCWGRLFFGVAVTKRLDLVNAINYHGILMLPCAFIWYFLTGKKDVKMFAFCMAALLYGAAVDLGSSSLLGTGGAVAVFPGVCCFLSLAREAISLIKRAAGEKAGRFARIAGRARSGAALLTAAACAVCCLLWNGFFVGLETVDSPIEHYISVAFSGGGAAYAVTLENGPFAGIVTSEKIASLYNGALEDLDAVKEAAAGGPVMTYGFTPFAYLYLDLPYGSHGAWYDGDLARTLAYWEKFPERRPACVYFPLFDNLYWASLKDMPVPLNREKMVRDITQQLSMLGDFEVTYGKSGVILKPVERG